MPVPDPGLRDSRTALVVSSLARTLLGALALLVLVSVVPAVAGWQATVVTSGSMAPAVQPGDVTLVRPVDPADLRPGQVLLVDDPDVPGGLRLHRLAAIEDGGLRLKGDANPTADGSLVSPTAVHGVGALRLPDLGLPALWASQGRWLPLSGTVLVLAVLVCLSMLHRTREDEEPAAQRPPSARRPRPRTRTALRGAAVGLVLAVLLPGTSGATFTATTANHVNTFTAGQWTSCALVARAEGPSAYYAFQDTRNGVAVNTGSTGTAANGRFTGGVTLTAGQPNCGPDGTKAVTFDGATGGMYTTYAVDNPQTFTVQLWFRTDTVDGGKLIGFGNGTNGDASSQIDRHVYMTNSGKLTFGVYTGTTETTTTSAAYNDGRWHLMTATFSPTTGLRLYVDGSLRASRKEATSAEDYTGYWRVGYDTLNGAWAANPRSEHFAGSIAHVSIYNDRMWSDAEVAEQFAAGS